MKIEKLSLVAFAHFTNKVLDLSQAQSNFHIIYGPNEAGKSSSLRALRQLLYGIPNQSTDNFLHSNANLRIGGQLLHTNGQKLDFIRRKGKVNTLRRADDDSPFEETVLHKFLDGLSQSLFESMFGINHKNLIEGGLALCNSKGELGQILFASGIGISNLQSIGNKLNLEAENLFLANGSKPLINSALNELKEAQKKLKEQEIPSSLWEKHNQALKEARELKQKLEARLTEKEQLASKLKRIKDAVPLVSQQREFKRELAQLEQAILLDPAFGERSRILQLELKQTRAEAKNLADELADLEGQLGRINLPEGFLEQGKVIEDLQKQLGSFQKAKYDRSNLRVRQNQSQNNVLNCLAELGYEARLEQCENLRITVAQRTHIAELAGTKAMLENQVQLLEKKAETQKEKLEHCRKMLGGLSHHQDPQALKAVIKRVELMGDLDSQLELAEGKAQQVRNQLLGALNRLLAQLPHLRQEIFPTENWAYLENLSLPSLATLDRFQRDFDRLEQQLTNLQQKRKQEEAEIDQIEERLEQARLEMETPTEEDLKQKRTLRSQNWSLIKRIWLAAEELSENQPTSSEQNPGDNGEEELAESFEKNIEECDQTADRLRREASRVAQKASLLANLSKHKERLAVLNLELETCHQEKQILQKKWQELWAPLQHPQPEPQEMRLWLENFNESLKLIEACRNAALNQNTLAQKIEKARNELQDTCLALEAASATEVSNTADGARSSTSLSRVLENAQNLLEKHQQAKNKYDNLQAELNNHESLLKEAELEVSRAREKLRAWFTDWTEALAPLKLNGETSPAQASAHLNTLEQMFKYLSEAQELKNRIDGIDRDGNSFFKAVGDLLKKLNLNVADLPLEQATLELNNRLVKAQEDKARLEILKTESKKKKESLQIGESKIARLENELEEMCHQAQCATVEELAPAGDRSNLLRELKNKQTQLEPLILNLSAGSALEHFCEEVANVDADSLAPQIEQLSYEIGELKQERSQIDQSIGAEQAELTKINGSGDAAQTAEQIQTQISKISSNCEEYVRLKVAKWLLNRSIERYREKNQSPVLTKASKVFQELTLGAFAGLREDFNEKGEPILVGVRAGNGEIVQLAAMSEGTGDQVYLALRLANLEVYLENHEPIPFIIDDILVNFDNERSVAALKALRQLSQKTQIIFFTHHAHLLDLAREALPVEDYSTHNLAALPQLRQETAGAVLF